MALVSVSVLPEVDKLFGRPANYTRDQFTGIARINADPSMLVVRADTPWKTLKDFVDDAKKKPGEIVFSSSGLYGTAHIPMEMFMLASGAKLRHLPTTGGRADDERHPRRSRPGGDDAREPRGGPGEGRQAAAPRPHGDGAGGRVSRRAVVQIAGLRRRVHRLGGARGPKGTPPHVIKILRDATRQAVKEPEVVGAHAKLDTPIAYMDADEFNAWWAQDAARLAEVVKKIGKVESAQ
jgi:tripartite-type tricarboxylate transporter receptor subunit TctC